MKADRSLRTVRLDSGGTVTLEVSVLDLLGIAPVERDLIFGLADSMDAYERSQRLARRRQRNADRWYHALLVEAVSTMAAGLTEEMVRECASHVDPSVRSAASVLLGRTMATAWGSLAEAHAVIAAAINHRRGVLT